MRKCDYKILASATGQMELPFPEEEKRGGTFCLRCLLDTTWRYNRWVVIFRKAEILNVRTHDHKPGHFELGSGCQEH